jgi:hypothetical protein
MRIVISNLPDEATGEGVAATLAGIAPVNAVKVVTEGNHPLAIIDMDMTREQAEALADRIKGRIYRGKPLMASVPLMDW